MASTRNRTHKLTITRALELRRRGETEDPRELAREYRISLAHAYAVIRGEAHHPRVTIPLDDETLVQLDAIARRRRLTIEELCEETVRRAAAEP